MQGARDGIWVWYSGLDNVVPGGFDLGTRLWSGERT